MFVLYQLYYVYPFSYFIVPKFPEIGSRNRQICGGAKVKAMVHAINKITTKTARALESFEEYLSVRSIL